MKGLVLAAGRGTRLRPLTNTRSKPMLPLANQPLISYPIQKLILAGVTEIGIVVGDNEQELRAGLGHIPADLSFIRQPEPKGLAHAVLCAREFCANDDFLLLFCDNLFSEHLEDSVALWNKWRTGFSGIGGMIHTITVDDPRAFGVAVVENGWVVDMEEKPANPRSNQAIVGIDFLTPEIFEAIGRIKPSARGELEITDAIFELTKMKLRVLSRELEGFWYDTGTFPDLINVLPSIMDNYGVYSIDGTVSETTVNGPADIARDSIVRNCKLIGPVMIAGGTTIENSTIGPYVAVGGGCRLTGCHLRHAQVYDNTILDSVDDKFVILERGQRISRETEPEK